ncbi:MAG: Uncharacterised protein [Oceanospirillaceae bacterium UBA2001]|nr:MAG: Uncharacterised protein [Oceanospirillaceae bacterium UBA2001]
MPLLSNCVLALLIDSTKRCLALPVGAAIAMLRGLSLMACKANNKRATVWVFPVPGPPEITLTWRTNASSTALACQSTWASADLSKS